jgi:hypothetical protein
MRVIPYRPADSRLLRCGHGANAPRLTMIEPFFETFLLTVGILTVLAVPLWIVALAKGRRDVWVSPQTVETSTMRRRDVRDKTKV